MNRIDKRDRLQEKPFTFQETKDGRVFIRWHGKQVMILKDKVSSKFVENISNMKPEEIQLLMARITGHFKHGNER